MIVNKLAKFSTTRSAAWPLCDFL